MAYIKFWCSDCRLSRSLSPISEEIGSAHFAVIYSGKFSFFRMTPSDRIGHHAEFTAEFLSYQIRRDDNELPEVKRFGLHTAYPSFLTVDKDLGECWKFGIF